MARTRDEQQHIFRCIEPFAVHRGGVPEVFGHDREVFGDDPILKTHRQHFEPASARVTRRAGVEQATAAPGEYRTVAPVSTVPEVSDE